MLGIKKNKQFLCSFMFKSGYDYRNLSELGAMAEPYAQAEVTEEMTKLAEAHGGRIAKLPD